MRKFDLVIFDCDGTLVDNMLLYMRSWHEVLAECGHNLSLTDHYGIAFGMAPTSTQEGAYQGHSEVDMIEDIQLRHNIRLPDDFRLRKKAHLRRLFEQELKTIHGIEDLLSVLAVPSCVASGAPMDALEHTLRTGQLWAHFEPNVFSAQQVPRNKPYPDVFLFAAKQMGVNPARCLVIEDSEVGIMAGKAAGMSVYGLASGSHCGPDHIGKLGRYEADCVFASVPEMTTQLHKDSIIHVSEPFRHPSPMGSQAARHRPRR